MKVYKIKYKILNNEKIINGEATNFIVNNNNFWYEDYKTGEVLKYEKQNIKILSIIEL